MDDIDLIVLKKLNQWANQNIRSILVTVLKTWGSSPRPIGSIMAISEKGDVVGSTSGGCIEEDLVRKYQDRNLFKRTKPEVLSYGIRAEEAHRFGLPCGGTIELLIEYNMPLQIVNQIISLISTRKQALKTTLIDTGEVMVRHAEQAQKNIIVNSHEVEHLLGPSYRMLIIGGGQLSEYLATMAIFNNFDVTVCDPRKNHISDWAVPKAHLVHGMPDDEVLAFNPDSRSCIVALTHDPKLDDMALLEALESAAFYIGAIGSRKNNENRRARLKQYFDISDENLSKLKGPVGLYIGSKTPSEIAVSIMAEIISIKNKINIPEFLNITNAKNRNEILEKENYQYKSCFSKNMKH